jgi:uncharacterized protein YbjT (DUF2867 family)
MAACDNLVLLTGATGFVGRRLWPRLESAGYEVRGMTRNPARARASDRSFFVGDVRSSEDVGRALDGARAAVYLVHGMAEGGRDFRRREVEAAHGFVSAARGAGLERIVYLGGMAPDGQPSEHLQSRLEVGEVLRGGGIKTIELRASMIVGYGSLSRMIVRDLAARLPVMILPRWLESRTEPVGVNDVELALVCALALDVPASACFDIPGPEALSGRELLERTARLLGLPKPAIVPVPLLTPRLSSQWIRFVTRAEWNVAREVVVGLEHDVLSRDSAYWSLVGPARRQTFSQAAWAALKEEHLHGPIPGAWGAVERAIDARRHAGAQG